MYCKEIIYHSNNELTEKIAHESAMASAIAEFTRSFNCGMINPTRESGYIINLYYQHKKQALHDIRNNYDFKRFDI